VLHTISKSPKCSTIWSKKSPKLTYTIPTNIQKQLTPQQKFNHSKNYPHFSKRPFVLGASIWGAFRPFNSRNVAPTLMAFSRLEAA
jgi:hypothetical protein